MRGADGVGFQEIHAYQEVTGHRLAPFERDLLLEIDQVRHRHNG